MVDARQSSRWYLVWSIVTVTAFLAGVVQAASLGDPFDGNSLQNPNWSWSIEPKEWDVGQTKTGWLHVKGEVNRNLWASDTTNRLYQERDGDFDVETHVFMDYKPSSTVAGLVAYSPTTKDRQGRAGEWVTLKLWGRGAAQGSNAVLQYQKREFDAGEGLVGTVPGFQEPAGPMDVFMRLKREGDTFTSWYKRQVGDNWTQIGQTDQKFEPDLQVGVYVGIADGAGEMISEFEYFEDLLEPFAISPRAKLPMAWGDLKRRTE